MEAAVAAGTRLKRVYKDVRVQVKHSLPEELPREKGSASVKTNRLGDIVALTQVPFDRVVVRVVVPKEGQHSPLKDLKVSELVTPGDSLDRRANARQISHLLGADLRVNEADVRFAEPREDLTETIKEGCGVLTGLLIAVLEEPTNNALKALLRLILRVS